MDDDDDEGAATSPRAAAAMDFDETTNASSKSQLNIPLPLPSPRLTQSLPPRTSPRNDITTSGLSPGKPPGIFGVTAVKMVERYREDGLSTEGIHRVSLVFARAHENASVEASVTTEIANQTLLAGLNGKQPKFSLSSEGGIVLSCTSSLWTVLM